MTIEPRIYSRAHFINCQIIKRFISMKQKIHKIQFHFWVGEKNINT